MLSINFSPFPILETERLLLRRIDKNDVDSFFALRSNAKMMEFIPRVLQKTKEETLVLMEQIDSRINLNEAINWAICLKPNTKMIGIISFHEIIFKNYRAEIGYMLLPDFHGKGIISEAVKRVVLYGFNDLKLNSIAAIIAPENIASEKVLIKNHFVKEAHFIENEFFDGKFIDTVIYSKLNKS